MIWYKKAAMNFCDTCEVPTNDTNSSNIVEFGDNSIESYADKSTDESVAQIVYSTFDMQPYRANYFLPASYDFAVRDDERKHFETKFQLSFKKNIAENILGFNEKLFLGYTQTSWWQTADNSSPFRETNYEPEIYFLFPYYSQKTALKAYKIGMIHQSNGQDAPKSRSWNRLYLGGIFQYDGFFIEPRVWYRFPEKRKSDITQSSGDDNPDIAEYLGYGDLKISYPYRSHVFSLLLRNNLEFNSNNRGAAQLDWTFPIAGVDDVFAYVQFFSGYGESLIDYNKHSDRISIGFSLSR